MSQQPQQQDMEAAYWASPADHFRPRLKFLTIFTDYHYNQMRWLAFKESVLNKWYVPWWTPLYQVSMWFTQRNRNLLLVENHLSYRPYRWRRDTENGPF